MSSGQIPRSTASCAATPRPRRAPRRRTGALYSLPANGWPAPDRAVLGLRDQPGLLNLAQGRAEGLYVVYSSMTHCVAAWRAVMEVGAEEAQERADDLAEASQP